MKGVFLCEHNNQFQKSQSIDNFLRNRSSSFDFAESNYQSRFWQTNQENDSQATQEPYSKEPWHIEEKSHGDYDEHENNQELNEDENDSFDLPLIPDLQKSNQQPEMKDTEFSLKKEINKLKKQLEQEKHSKNIILDGYQKLQKKYTKLEQDNKFLQFCLKIRKPNQFQSQILNDDADKKNKIKTNNLSYSMNFQSDTFPKDQKTPLNANKKASFGQSANKKGFIKSLQRQK